MKKLLYNSALLLALAMGTQSCALHSGLLTSGANLQAANFSYISTNVQGTSSTLKIFGIGGLAKNALVAEAKKDLMSKSPLKANQAYTNFSVDFKLSLLPIVTTERCTVTADIVEFR